MIELVKSDVFIHWFTRLKDKRAKVAIANRLTRFERGLLGDVKSVGGGVSEARIFIGKGYRLYFTKQGEELVVLLCGGDKSSQERDIKQAKELAKLWR